VSKHLLRKCKIKTNNNSVICTIINEYNIVNIQALESTCHEVITHQDVFNMKIVRKSANELYISCEDIYTQNNKQIIKIYTKLLMIESSDEGAAENIYLHVAKSS